MHRLLLLLAFVGCGEGEPALPTSHPALNELSIGGILIQCTPPQVPRLIAKGDALTPACIAP